MLQLIAQARDLGSDWASSVRIASARAAAPPFVRRPRRSRVATSRARDRRSGPGSRRLEAIGGDSAGRKRLFPYFSAGARSLGEPPPSAARMRATVGPDAAGVEFSAASATRWRRASTRGEIVVVPAKHGFFGRLSMR